MAQGLSAAAEEKELKVLFVAQRQEMKRQEVKEEKKEGKEEKKEITEIDLPLLNVKAKIGEYFSVVILDRELVIEVVLLSIRHCGVKTFLVFSPVLQRPDYPRRLSKVKSDLIYLRPESIRIRRKLAIAPLEQTDLKDYKDLQNDKLWDSFERFDLLNRSTGMMEQRVSKVKAPASGEVLSVIPPNSVEILIADEYGDMENRILTFNDPSLYPRGCLSNELPLASYLRKINVSKRQMETSRNIPLLDFDAELNLSDYLPPDTDVRLHSEIYHVRVAAIIPEKLTVALYVDTQTGCVNSVQTAAVKQFLKQNILVFIHLDYARYHLNRCTKESPQFHQSEITEEMKESIRKVQCNGRYHDHDVVTLLLPNAASTEASVEAIRTDGLLRACFRDERGIAQDAWIPTENSLLFPTGVFDGKNSHPNYIAELDIRMPHKSNDADVCSIKEKRDLVQVFETQMPMLAASIGESLYPWVIGDFKAFKKYVIDSKTADVAVTFLRNAITGYGKKRKRDASSLPDNFEIDAFVKTVRAESRKPLIPTEDKKSEKSNQCPLCYTREADIALLPCGHLCSCSVCSNQLEKRCPICRSVWTSKQRIIRS